MEALKGEGFIKQQFNNRGIYAKVLVEIIYTKTTGVRIKIDPEINYGFHKSFDVGILDALEGYVYPKGWNGLKVKIVDLHWMAVDSCPATVAIATRRAMINALYQM